MSEKADLTQIKGYRGWEMDEESVDTLTQVRGYRTNEHEFSIQAGVFGEDSRPLSAGWPSSQEQDTRRVLFELRVSPKGGGEAFGAAIEGAGSEAAWAKADL